MRKTVTQLKSTEEVVQRLLPPKDRSVPSKLCGNKPLNPDVNYYLMANGSVQLVNDDRVKDVVLGGAE